MLNLKYLEDRLDEVLSKETPESLNEWLQSKRNGGNFNSITVEEMVVEEYFDCFDFYADGVLLTAPYSKPNLLNEIYKIARSNNSIDYDINSWIISPTTDEWKSIIKKTSHAPPDKQNKKYKKNDLETSEVIFFY